MGWLVSSTLGNYLFFEVLPICLPLLGVQQDLSHPNYARHKLHENDDSIPLLHVAWYVTNLLVNIPLSYEPYYPTRP